MLHIPTPLALPSHLISYNSITSHATTSHRMPPQPIPSHLISFMPPRPIDSHRIPSHSVPLHPTPSNPVPSYPTPSHPMPRYPTRPISCQNDLMTMPMAMSMMVTECGGREFDAKGEGEGTRERQARREKRAGEVR